MTLETPRERRWFNPAALPRPYMRRDLDEKKLAELMADIKERGLLEPPHVTPSGEVLSGNCRVECCKRLGIQEVNCDVYDYATEAEKLRHVFSADKKSDVSKLDVALRLAGLRAAQPELTGKALAQAVGVSEATVSRAGDVLALPPELLDAVLTGQLLPAHVLVVGKVKERDKKAELLTRALAEKLSPKELSALVKPKRGPASKSVVFKHAGLVVSCDAAWGATKLGEAIDALKAHVKEKLAGIDKRSLDLKIVLKGA